MHSRHHGMWICRDLITLQRLTGSSRQAQWDCRL